MNITQAIEQTKKIIVTDNNLTDFILTEQAEQKNKYPILSIFVEAMRKLKKIAFNEKEKTQEEEVQEEVQKQEVQEEVQEQEVQEEIQEEEIQEEKVQEEVQLTIEEQEEKTKQSLRKWFIKTEEDKKIRQEQIQKNPEKFIMEISDFHPVNTKVGDLEHLNKMLNRTFEFDREEKPADAELKAMRKLLFTGNEKDIFVTSNFKHKCYEEFYVFRDRFPKKHVIYKESYERIKKLCVNAQPALKELIGDAKPIELLNKYSKLYIGDTYITTAALKDAVVFFDKAKNRYISVDYFNVSNDEDYLTYMKINNFDMAAALKRKMLQKTLCKEVITMHIVQKKIRTV